MKIVQQKKIYPLTFLDRLIQSIKERESNLCIGLDPDLRLLPMTLRSSSKSIAEKFEIFCKGIIEATAQHCCSFKFQAAMFASEACEELLSDIIKWVKLKYPSHIVIFDGKRGDIGNTSIHYAKEAFERFQSDVATVSPFMGEDSIRPFLDWKDKGIFLLCSTSNPGAEYMQGSIHSEKGLEQKLFFKTALLAEKLNKEIMSNDKKQSSSLNQTEMVGLVVGANRDYHLNILKKRFKNIPLLIPGIGAQGGTVKKLINSIDLPQEKKSGGFQAPHIINVSRSVIYAGSNEDWIDCAASESEKLKNELLIFKNVIVR
ncbi:MAG: orotidine-5'-phosphate decarboxylase [Betaproteobacteria bacterium TMED82]|jgi:orotidine-5'-phosphate decarboxylase|nr:MAG: orotidine-5'-phosphate decarboxylase [Betaproteobacteria bacterium TMED82]|tara:strand:- start:30656 stop:31603 length:948 start_codon:yes stop_codon:yes gene_type:complete